MTTAVLTALALQLTAGVSPVLGDATFPTAPSFEDAYPDSVVAVVSVGNDPRDLCYDASADRIFLVIGFGYVPVIDATSYSLLAFVPVGDSPSDVCVLPSGDFAYVCDDGDNIVRVIDTSSYTVVNEITVPYTSSAIEALPGGEGVAVLHGAGHLTMIDIPADTVSGTYWVGYSPGGFCVPDQGTSIFVSDRNSAYASELLLPGYSVSRFFVGGDTYDACVLPTGDLLYMNVRDWDIISVLSIPDNQVVDEIFPVGTSPNRICALPTGGFVYVSDDELNILTVIRTSDNAVVASVDVGGDPSGICASPDGEFVFVANSGSNNMSVLGRSTTGISGPVIPSSLSVSAFPNPCSANSMLSIGIGRRGDLRIDVYGMDGRLSVSILESALPAGSHSIPLTGLAPGAYLVRAASGEERAFTRLLVLD